MSFKKDRVFFKWIFFLILIFHKRMKEKPEDKILNLTFVKAFL